jgi:lysophospholipase L1-like esterase
MRRIFAVLVLLATLVVVLPGVGAADSPPATLRVLALGDSITRGGYGGDDPGRVAWRREFVDLAAAAGTTVDMTVMAAGGWSTADVLPQLAAVLLDKRPDLVIIALGTNDAKDPGLAGFRDRYSRILGTILDVSDAQIALTLITYSAIGVPFATTEASVNDTIWSLMSERGLFAPGGIGPGTRWAGWAHCDAIAWTYLVDGVHLYHAGYVVMGWLMYEAVMGNYGWPAVSLSPAPLLTGHRP